MRARSFAVPVIAVVVTLAGVGHAAIRPPDLLASRATAEPSPRPTLTAPPTPKATPKPKPPSLEERAARAERKADECGSESCRRRALEDVVRDAWTADGEDHLVAQVIPCESRWNRHDVGSQGELGLAQVHPTYWRSTWQAMGYSDADMARVVPNLRVAQRIFDSDGDGHGSWGPWTCG